MITDLASINMKKRFRLRRVVAIPLLTNETSQKRMLTHITKNGLLHGIQTWTFNFAWTILQSLLTLLTTIQKMILEP